MYKFGDSVEISIGLAKDFHIDPSKRMAIITKAENGCYSLSNPEWTSSDGCLTGNFRAEDMRLVEKVSYPINNMILTLLNSCQFVEFTGTLSNGTIVTFR